MVLCLVLFVARAPFAQGLGLEVFVRMHMPSGKLVERSINNNDVLRSGDEFRVRVGVAGEGFLYVLHQGTTRAMVLFPANFEPDTATRVREGVEVVLPAENLFFTLDETLGPERVLVLLARKPIRDMNTVLTVAAASPVDRGALRRVGVDDAAELVFGHIAAASLGLVPGEATSDNRSSASAGTVGNEAESTGPETSGTDDQILGDVGSRIDNLLIELDVQQPVYNSGSAAAGKKTGVQGEGSVPTASVLSTRKDEPSEQYEFSDTAPARSEETADILGDDPADLAVVTVVEDSDASLDNGEGQRTTTSETAAEIAGTTGAETTQSTERAETLVPDNTLDAGTSEQSVTAPLPRDDPGDAIRVTVVEDDTQTKAPVLAISEPARSDDDNDVAVNVVSELDTGAMQTAMQTAQEDSAQPEEEEMDANLVVQAERLSAADPNAGASARLSEAKFQRVHASAVLIPTSRGFASGVLLDMEGHVLTNWHVVEGRQFIPVLVQAAPDAGGAARMTKARVLASNQAPDLALLKLQAPLGSLTPIDVPTALRLELGDVVYALGSADSTLALRMAEGEIDRFVPYASWRSVGEVEHAGSVIRARVRDLPASSGTLLLDRNLRLVGIGISSDKDAEGFSAISLDSILEFLSEYGGGRVKLKEG